MAMCSNWKRQMNWSLLILNTQATIPVGSILQTTFVNGHTTITLTNLHQWTWASILLMRSRSDSWTLIWKPSLNMTTQTFWTKQLRPNACRKKPPCGSWQAIFLGVCGVWFKQARVRLISTTFCSLLNVWMPSVKNLLNGDELKFMHATHIILYIVQNKESQLIHILYLSNSLYHHYIS